VPVHRKSRQPLLVDSDGGGAGFGLVCGGDGGDRDGGAGDGDGQRCGVEAGCAHGTVGRIAAGDSVDLPDDSGVQVADGEAAKLLRGPVRDRGRRRRDARDDRTQDRGGRRGDGGGGLVDGVVGGEVDLAVLSAIGEVGGRVGGDDGGCSIGIDAVDQGDSSRAGDSVNAKAGNEKADVSGVAVDDGCGQGLRGSNVGDGLHTEGDHGAAVADEATQAAGGKDNKQDGNCGERDGFRESGTNRSHGHPRGYGEMIAQERLKWDKKGRASAGQETYLAMILPLVRTIRAIGEGIATPVVAALRVPIMGILRGGPD